MNKHEYYVALYTNRHESIDSW